VSPASEGMLRLLQEDDLEAYLALRDQSFGYPPGEATRATIRTRLARTLGAFTASGDLVASVADHRLETFIAGRPLPLQGVGALQTAVTARRRGIAVRLLERLLVAARDAGVGWSLLYPFDPRFYARLGWQSLPTGVRLALDLPWWERPGETLAEQVTGELRVALQPVYLRCAAGWNFTNARTRGPWDVWQELLPEPGSLGTAYRVEDGYAVLRVRHAGPQQFTLDVVDASWCTAVGRAAVLALLRAHLGHVQRIELEVPRDDALAWDWADWWPVATASTRMVRVVDVRAAMAPLATTETLAAVTLRIHDPLAPWNDGTWRFTPGADGCDVQRAAGTAAATIDVRALPLLVGGAASPAAVVRAGLADGPPAALSPLAGLAGGLTPYQAASDRF
jgi:predicted acetyltransferase